MDRGDVQFATSSLPWCDAKSHTDRLRLVSDRHCEELEGRRSNPERVVCCAGLLRFRLRAPRFGGLKPDVARAASEGGSLAMTVKSSIAWAPCPSRRGKC